MARNWFIWLLLPLLLAMCKGNQRVTKTNLAYLYTNNITIIHPVYKVYHNDDEKTTIYVRIRSSEILYSKNNPEKKFEGRMVMRLQIYGLEDRHLVVSDTVFLVDKGGPSEERYLVGRAEVELPYGRRYLSEMTFDDQYRMQFVQDVLFINKTNEMSKENFLVTNEKGEVQFGPYYDPGSKLNVQSNHDLPDQMTMTISDLYENLPPPPFAIQEIDAVSGADEREKLIKCKDRRNFTVELGEAGVYYFANEADETGGLTFLVFHSFFPYIKTVASMVKPMRFITTKQEYEAIVNSDNTKKSVDEFWFKIAGNAERAAGVINEYYSRVELANRYFTSYMQGWKTDRGLIYIIYGPPTSVIRAETYESWMYTEKSNVMSVEFNFIRIDHPLSSNNYVLNRSLAYKSSWYRAIDSWRQGRIYQ